MFFATGYHCLKWLCSITCLPIYCLSFPLWKVRSVRSGIQLSHSLLYPQCLQWSLVCKRLSLSVLVERLSEKPFDCSHLMEERPGAHSSGPTSCCLLPYLSLPRPLWTLLGFDLGCHGSPPACIVLCPGCSPASVSISAGLISAYLLCLSWDSICSVVTVDNFTKLLPFGPEISESTFRKFRGLLVFLELGVSLNVNNKTNAGDFD